MTNEQIQQLEADINHTFTHAPDHLMANTRLAVPHKPASLNGITHGLSGQNVLITAAELPFYFSMGLAFLLELAPVGIREVTLAQRIFDANWRLNRVSSIENNLLNAGQSGIYQPAKSTQAAPVGEERGGAAVSQALVFRAESETFERLGRYETRLVRNSERWTAEFDALQKRRQANPNYQTFDPAHSPAIQWYESMTRMAEQLQAAKAELAKANRPESTGSRESSVGKTTAQLSAEVLKTLAMAAKAGLLTEEDQAAWNGWSAAA